MEKVSRSANFEQQSYYETEQKFLPTDPEKLERFRSGAARIEQIYLSSPQEEFSLRLRETTNNQTTAYHATLKDMGTLTKEGLRRLEVETPIEREAYEFYRSLGYPALKKIRAEPEPNIAIDYFEDSHIHVESENPASWRRFIENYDLRDNFTEITDSKLANNEWRAYEDYQQNHDGRKAFATLPELHVDVPCREIIEHQTHSPITIARISGRSGSGKSTFIRNLQEMLEDNGIVSAVLSTDDYHRGKSWLEAYNHGDPWTEWDAPIVYDRDALLRDIETLAAGTPIVKRTFDFSMEEPVFSETIQPAQVIVIEGIYAKHSDFDNAHLHYEITTPLATCIGRRILRDLVERPHFSQPAASLRYILESAEPAYRTI